MSRANFEWPVIEGLPGLSVLVPANQPEKFCRSCEVPHRLQAARAYAHPNPGAKIMTTTAHTGERSILSLAALVLSIGMTSGLFYFAPSLANEPTVPSIDNGKGHGIATKSTSEIVPCLMPEAWRRACKQ